MGAHIVPKGRTAVLLERLKDGETLTTKELWKEFWPHLHIRSGQLYAGQQMISCKKWFLRWGISFGYDKVKKGYCVLDSTNVIRASDDRIKLLQGWTKRVQNEIDVGMEQFGNDPQIRNFFELAVNEVQQTFLDSRRKQLRFLNPIQNAD